MSTAYYVVFGLINSWLAVKWASERKPILMGLAAFCALVCAVELTTPGQVLA